MTLDGILDIAAGKELLVALTAHLRANLVQPGSADRADLEQEIDVGAGLDQALEVALADELLLRLGEVKAGHERFLVALEGLALLRRAERCAQLVQAPTAAREVQ